MARLHPCHTPRLCRDPTKTIYFDGNNIMLPLITPQPTPLYPVRNNAPLLPPGQRPSLRARGSSEPEAGPAATAGSNAPLGFESQRLEFLTGFTSAFFLNKNLVLLGEMKNSSPHNYTQLQG